MIRRRSSRVKLKKKTSASKGFDDYEIKLGDTMRGERATLGKSLIDVQNDLKIKSIYIQAVEDANPMVFDTPGFIAGYVRSYAKYLGLDPEKSFELFCSESGFTPVHGMDPEKALPKRSKNVGGIKDTEKYPKSGFGTTSATFAPPKETLLNKVDLKSFLSSMVLIFFLLGLAFGIQNVFKKIQQVQITAIDQPPVIPSDLDPLIPFASSSNTSKTDLVANSNIYNRIYRPKALDMPIIESRDGPISGIDPNILGTFGSLNVSSLSKPKKISDDLSKMKIISQQKPEKTVTDTVQLLAAEGVWIRIKDDAGSILYERIMDARKPLDLPVSKNKKFIDRAGNSGALFFVVNGKLYGPAGEKTRTVKNIELSARNIKSTYSLYTPGLESSLYSFLNDIESDALSD